MKTPHVILMTIGFAVALLLLCYIWAPASAQVVVPVEPMPVVVGDKWEYKIVTRDIGIEREEEEAEFNELGDERWELATTGIRAKDGGPPVISFVFKRPKQ